MIDVTGVVINEEANEVVITGVDLDRIWTFEDEPSEDTELPEVSYKFNINSAGARKYLYLITRNCSYSNGFKNMNQRLEALVGQIIYISSNFLVKDEA